MSVPVTFSLNSRNRVSGSELYKPGYYPGRFYHLGLWISQPPHRPTAIGVAYLIPLLELGGRDAAGDFRPESCQLVRKGGDGEELKGEFSDFSKPSPWIEDGDEIVLRGRVSVQNRNPSRPPTPPRRRAVLPPSSR